MWLNTLGEGNAGTKQTVIPDEVVDLDLKMNYMCPAQPSGKHSNNSEVLKKDSAGGVPVQELGCGLVPPPPGCPT